MATYGYRVDILTLGLDELVFDDSHCWAKDISLDNQDIYETIAVKVGEDAHRQAHGAAVKHLEAHFRGRWAYLAAELDDGTIQDVYPYGWKDNRTGLRPALVRRFDVEKVTIV